MLQSYISSEEQRDGISVILASMNRTDRLVDCLKYLSDQKQISEIVVVDWNSAVPVEESLVNVDDDRIVLVTVSGVSIWNLSKANNLAARFASCKYLCKMDVDYVLNSSFFELHVPIDCTIWRGDYTLARDRNELSLSGFFLLPRESFLAVNGFNERFEGWGYDELDLYTRCEQLGLTSKSIDFDYIYHTPHPATLRAVNTPGLPPDLNELVNRKISARYPWSRDEQCSEYITTTVSKKNYHCKLSRSPKPPPKSVYEACVAETISHLTRFAINQLAGDAGGYLWGRTPKQLEEIIFLNAPRGVKKMSWFLRRELKEIYHLLLRSRVLSRRRQEGKFRIEE